jgi:putative transposase
MSTYTQIHLHIIFAVKYRKALIDPEWKEELHRYMTAIIQNRSHKVLAINTMPDHIHILIGYRPADPLPDLMRVLKGDSSAWINRTKKTSVQFAWQSGYAAISYSRAEIPVIANYIANQEEHHKKTTHREELIAILEEAGVEWKPEYLFVEPI